MAKRPTRAQRIAARRLMRGKQLVCAGFLCLGLPLSLLADEPLPPSAGVVQATAISTGWEASQAELATAQIIDPLTEPTGAAPLNLDALQQLALASNPSIQRAAALVSAARGNMLQVGLPANPEVGFDGQQIGSGGQAEQYGIMVSQEFIRREKLQLNRAVAGHEVRRLEQEFAAQRGRVLTDVRMSFMRALRAQRQIEMVESLVEINRQALGVAEALQRAAEVGRADVLQAELEVESALILLENARNRQTASWQELASVVGQRELPIQSLDGDLFAPAINYDFQGAVSMLQDQSPEIAAVIASIERARCNLRRQQVEPLPNVTAQGLINWRDNGIGGDPDGGVAVSIPVPLWNRNQGAIHEAHQQLRAAHRELAQVELDLQNRLVPVFERYRNAVIQVQRYQETILPKSKETLELTRRTYELGEINFIALLTAQRTYAQTQLAYLDAAEALRLSEAEIEGLLLSNSLSLR
jgi:cobalt-zinc-cadmium efflux system outer membrane protein